MICKKCGNHFPVKVRIDTGKMKNLGSRSYCLSCSPFKSHNTRKLEVLENLGKQDNVCFLCGKNFIYDRHKGNRINTCSACFTKLYRKRKKIQLVELKGGKCIICGYNRCIEALEFHHLDSSKKSFTISMFINKPMKILIEEIKKCILVCSNCHKEINMGIIVLPAEYKI